MDFGALAPEINSARMYSGPGSTAMVAASSAWNRLSAELSSAATGYGAVITRLSGEEWMGPASASMAAAAAPYVAWLSATAVQAEQAATQASSAAAAYEAAFAATVPPPLIAANRAALQSLLATNLLGQNGTAIAANQAQYGEMWAQDAEAMYSYAASSAAAARVTPFASPQQTTNPAGQAAQGAAVAQATGTSAGTATDTLSQLISSAPNALQGLASPAASTSDPLGGILLALTGSSAAPSSLPSALTDLQPYASFLYNTEGLPYFSIGMGNNFVQIAKTFGLIGGAAPAAAKAAAGLGSLPDLSGLGGALGGASGIGAPLAAGIGQAASVGKLSVPISWAGSTPATLVSSTAPVPVSVVRVISPEGAPGSMMGGLPMAGAGGAGGSGAGPRYGFKPTIVIRPPFAG
ncbi:MAG: PPE family protein [Mycobacterium sp.]